MKLPRLFKIVIIAGLVVSCSSNQKVVREERRLTEREVTFQKGLALFNISKYIESAGFFMKVTQNPLSDSDEIYHTSLWCLSIIYEKHGDFDKAILALQELKVRKPSTISLFKIQLSLMKNYIRVGNNKMASEIRKQIDTSFPLDRYGINEIYFSIAENVNFNYDLSMLEELQFLGEVQKYFIYVMESKEPVLNEKSTELLITLYDGFFKAIEKDSFNNDFKKSLVIELLEQMRRFDRYKLDDLNLNPKTISKFSLYSIKKEQFLTDWLHQ
jgi:tetratricopeptide (TPR) repeat protein